MQHEAHGGLEEWQRPLKFSRLFPMPNRESQRRARRVPPSLEKESRFANHEI
jgi:hypothetical protein